VAWSRLTAQAPLLLTCLCSVVFATAYAIQAILRHDSLGSNALDLGYEDQALWNTLHGHPYAFSLLSGGGFSLDYQAPLDHSAQTLLAYHAELLLAPLSLLYAVLPDVRALLALQALVVCAGALAAFGLARIRLGSAWAGFFVALAYLSSPFVEAELLSDFHTVALDSALFILLFYLIERRLLWPVLVTGLLAAAAKEDAPVALTLLGLWTLLGPGGAPRWRVAGLALLALGSTVALFDFFWLIPHFSPGQASPFLARYGYLGTTPLAMLSNVLRHPAVLGPTLGSSESRAYLQALVGSSGALALFSPLTLLIAAPSIGINVLATFPWMRSGMAHYSALVLPILIAAAIEGIGGIAWLLERLRGHDAQYGFVRAAPRRYADEQGRDCGPRGRPRPSDEGRLRSLVSSVRGPERDRSRPSFLAADRSRGPVRAYLNRIGRDARAPALLLAAWLAVAAALTHYQLGSGLGGRAFALPLPDAHARLLPRFLAQIPAGDAVSTSSSLAPHLSERRKLYLFPNVLDAQEVLLDLTSSSYPLNWSQQRLTLLTLLQGGSFGVADAADGYVLLRRGAPLRNLPRTAFSFSDGSVAALSQQPLATFDGHLFLLDDHIQASSVIGAGWQETLTLDWTLDQPLADDETLAVWTNGTPRPRPPDFQGPIPTLTWRATSNWQPGQVIRVVVPGLTVAYPGQLQIAWFHPKAEGSGLDWLPCVNASGQTCPLGNHYVIGAPPVVGSGAGLMPWLAALNYLRGGRAWR